MLFGEEHVKRYRETDGVQARLMMQRWPAYAAYQTKTSREIPVVVLERS